MNTFTILNVITKSIGVLLILIGGEYLLLYTPNLLNTILNSVAVIYALLTALVTIMWHGINRLNSLDNLEGMKQEYTRIIQSKIAGIKHKLYKRVVLLILASLFLFVFSVTRNLSPFMDILLSIVIPIILIIILATTMSCAPLFISIDEFRQKTTELCQKEKARRKLIDEMKKDRQSHPLAPDSHLNSYKKLSSEVS